MTTIAELALAVDARQVDAATPKLKALGDASGRTETAVRGLTNSAKELDRALVDQNAHVSAYLANAARMLEAQRAAERASLKAAAASKLHGHELLNLSRQFADVGVSAAMGMSPLMILVQQGPQISETLAVAAARGVTFSSALGQLATAAKRAAAAMLPLLIQFAPLIAGVAALGAGLILLTKHFNDARAKNEELSTAATKLSAELDKLDPSLNAVANASSLAAEGSRNFSNWLKAGTEQLGTYAQQLKTATVNQLMFNAAQAGNIAEQYRQNNTHMTPRGRVTNMFTNQNAYTAEQARLDAVAARATEAARKAMDAPDSAFTGKTERATAAMREATKAANDYAAAAENVFDVYGLEWAKAYGNKPPPVLEVQTALNMDGITSALPELSANFRMAANDFEDAFTEAAFSIGWQFDSVFNDFARKDWMSAFAGLFSAVDAFKSQWNSGAAGSRVGAVAGVGQSVGSAIGGTAGATLGGAAGGLAAGASIGALFGGGGAIIGAAIGAVVGGLAGFISSSSAKKKQQAEERARAASEAATLAQETLNQQNEIAIQTMILLGDAQGARNLQLQAERAGIAASNLAAFDEMVVLRDAQSLRLKNIELLKVQGQTELAQAMERDDIRKTLVSAELAVQEEIWKTIDANNALAISQANYAQALADADSAIAQAQQDLTAARNAETQSLRSAAQEQAQSAQATLGRLKGITESLTAFNAGGAGSLSYAAANARFNDINRRGRLGDLDAGEKAASTFTELLEVSKRTSTSAIQYQRDVARTRLSSDAILAVTGRQTSIAQQQLDAANAQLSALATVNESVLTVAQATTNLGAAMAALAALKAAPTGAVGGPGGIGQKIPWTVTPTENGSYAATPDPNNYGPMTPSGRTATNYLLENPDVWDAASHQNAMSEAEYARQHYEMFGKSEGRVGFATGGSFKVGGSGGPDSKAFSLALTPGEMVDVRRPGDRGDPALLAAVERLTAQVVDLKAEQVRTTAESKKTADMLTFVTRNGDALRTVAA